MWSWELSLKASLLGGAPSPLALAWEKTKAEQHKKLSCSYV